MAHELAVNGSAKIVLVEDEAFQRQLIAECLAQHGLRPITFASGAELKRAAQHCMPDLALLDVHLNEAEDGFALARWLRGRSVRIGIIMLTVAGDTIDRVVGLESGADDYVGKPFEPRELVARVKALLRRTGPAAQLPPRLNDVRVGTAMLDLQRHVLVLADGSASSSDRQRVRPAPPVRGEPQSPAHPRLVVGNRCASRCRFVRPRNRQSRHAPASQGWSVIRASRRRSGAYVGSATCSSPQRTERITCNVAANRPSNSSAARRAVSRSPALAAVSARAACSARSFAPAMRAAPVNRWAKFASCSAFAAACIAAMSRLALSAKFSFRAASRPVSAPNSPRNVSGSTGAGRPLAGIAAGAELRDPAAERAGQCIQRDGLGQEPVHPGGEAMRVFAL